MPAQRARLQCCWERWRQAKHIGAEGQEERTKQQQQQQLSFSNPPPHPPHLQAALTLHRHTASISSISSISSLPRH